jgi:hypothetical protein
VVDEMNTRSQFKGDFKKTEGAGKKPYVSPKLVFYGDVRSLTRSGSGSQTEPINSGNGSPQKRP